MELSSSGSILATNTFGPSGPLARTSNCRTLLYTTDVQGIVSQQIYSATGAVVASYGFDVWGHRSVVTNDPTASSDPYTGFGGMEGYYTDWETRPELCGLRYYDSCTGRWLNRQPISYAGGVNLYEYCNNNGVDIHDTTGTMSGIGTILKCIGTIYKIYKQYQTSNGNILNAICLLVTDCGACILCGSLVSNAIDKLTEGFETGGPGSWLTAALFSCLYGAICGVVKSYLDRLCHYQ